MSKINKKLLYEFKSEWTKMIDNAASTNSMWTIGISDKPELKVKKVKNKVIPKTQKAKGIMLCLKDTFKEIGDNGFNFSLNRFIYNSPHTLISSIEDIKKNTNLPAFARPCPIKPKHGFVDSRVIKTNNALSSLWKETKKHDPDSEIILGPFFEDVKYNAVYVTGGLLSIGRGNDGATAGKKSISLRVAPFNLDYDIHKKAGIKRDEAVYIEAICPNPWFQWTLTQLRGGPAITEASSDFIPDKLKIKKIIKPNDNLIEWETQVKNLEPGTAVYAPGHTLASHAAIHSVLNKIPFITSFKPEINQTIKPTEDFKFKIDRVDFRRGVRAGINICSEKSNMSAMNKYLYYSLSVLHNWAYIKNSDNASWILGSATSILSKIGTALALGEYRHSPEFVNKDSRKWIYEETLRRDIGPFADLTTAFNGFHKQRWGSGFGGIPWANCAWHTYTLWKGIAKIYNKETKIVSEKEIADVMGTMNRIVNQAHNNGWWFNKIAIKEDMDFIAAHPGVAALCVSDIFLEVNSKFNSVSKNLKGKLKIDSIKCPSGMNGNKELLWLSVSNPGPTARFKLRTDNNGETVYIQLNKKEVAGLKRKKKRTKGKTMYLKINKDGKFKVPGGKDRNIHKVFKYGIYS